MNMPDLSCLHHESDSKSSPSRDSWALTVSNGLGRQLPQLISLENFLNFDLICLHFSSRLILEKTCLDPLEKCPELRNSYINGFR